MSDDDIEDNKHDFAVQWGSPKMHRNMISHSVASARSIAETHSDYDHELKNHPHPSVRRKVAENSEDPKLLHELAHDKEGVVREGVAANGHAQAHTLTHLMHDDHEYTRHYLPTHRNITDEHLDHLVNDPVDAVRKQIAIRGPDKYRTKLLSDGNHTIGQTAARFMNTEEGVSAAANHPGAHVRLGLTANKGRLAIKHIEHMAQHDPHEFVRDNAQTALKPPR